MKKIFLFLMICLVCCSGCASLDSRLKNGNIISSKIYPGVKHNLDFINKYFDPNSDTSEDYGRCGDLGCYPGRMIAAPVVMPFCWGDLALSATVDTVLLPVDSIRVLMVKESKSL